MIPAQVVQATLSDDESVLVSVRALPGEQQVAAGQLPPAQVESALAGIRATCDALVAHLQAIEATHFAIEFNVGFAVKSGKLMSLMFEPEASAGLKVSIQWERKP